MELVSWILTLITGFLLSFVWTEIKNKLYRQITIFDELKKYGLIRKGDPMENRLENIEKKLDLILEKLSKLDDVPASLIRLENRINSSLGYLEEVTDIKENLAVLKISLDNLNLVDLKKKVENLPTIKRNDSEDNSECSNEDQNESNASENEEEINTLLLELKARSEKEQKLDVVEYILNTEPKEYFKNPKFFPAFQEEIRKRNPPKSQVITEILAIKRLPPIDPKAPLLDEVYEKMNKYLSNFKSINAFMSINSNMMDIALPKIIDIAFIIIILGTHQKSRIPEVFEVEEDFTIDSLFKKIRI